MGGMVTDEWTRCLGPSRWTSRIVSQAASLASIVVAFCSAVLEGADHSATLPQVYDALVFVRSG